MAAFSVGMEVKLVDYMRCSDWATHKDQIATITDLNWDGGRFPIQIEWADGSHSTVDEYHMMPCVLHAVND